MLFISTYQDLLREIEIYQNRLEDLYREDYALRRIEYEKIELDIYVDRKHKINNEAAILQSLIEDKKQTQMQLLVKLSQLEGLEYKIAYKRFVEGKPLNKIAEELGYSYDYMREVSSKNKKTHNYPTDK